MTDSKEESKKLVSPKRVSDSKDLIALSNRGKKSSLLKEGVLLVSLALVIMIAAYFVYNGGFGMMDGAKKANTPGDGLCQANENCMDSPLDCKCPEGKACSLQDKTCVDAVLPPASDNAAPLDSVEPQMLPAEDMPGVVVEIPANITLSNCVYKSAEGTIECETNCLGSLNGESALSIMDANTNLSGARQSAVPIKLGTVYFEAGKVTAKPDHVEFAGSLISSSLSELDANTSDWKVYLSCGSPKGSATLEGVSK